MDQSAARAGGERRRATLIYAGRCLKVVDKFRRIVNECEVLSVSIVDKPEQKYSVLFLKDEKTGNKLDHYRYDLVEYAAKALRNPFDKWDVEQTTRRQPHKRFANVGRNDPCPCESGKKYKRCCLPEAGVLRPHFQFTFALPPPDGTISDTAS